MKRGRRPFLNPSLPPSLPPSKYRLSHIIGSCDEGLPKCPPFTSLRVCNKHCYHYDIACATYRVRRDRERVTHTRTDTHTRTRTHTRTNTHTHAHTNTQTHTTHVSRRHRRRSGWSRAYRKSAKAAHMSPMMACSSSRTSREGGAGDRRW